MSRKRPRQNPWLTGRFDHALSALLAILVVAIATTRQAWLPAAVDLAACAAAALTTRWPRFAGIALAAIVGSLLFTPPGWVAMGEYAALIPILGTGIRGQRRERLWMTIVYGAILAALSYDIAEGRPTWPLAIAVWGALIAILWGIGNLFTAYREAMEQAHGAELQQHRLAVARDLHDTVSRELARASLQAQAARQDHSSARLDAVVTDIQRASTQLRWMLSLLREDASRSQSEPTVGSASGSLQEAMGSLAAKGFSVSMTVDGAIDDLPPALRPTVRAAIGEACANIERHADPDRPCSIVISIDGESFDAVFLNERPLASPAPTPLGVGLRGLGERLTLVGGDLAIEEEGSRWLIRITIPG